MRSRTASTKTCGENGLFKKAAPKNSLACALCMAAGMPDMNTMARLGVRASAFVPIENDGRLIGLLAAGADESRSALSLRLPALV